jgi:phosphohistidine phosphatase
MKRLYILRNAHAAIGAIDRERELDDRGVQEIESIAHQMIENGMRPNVILTGSARRSIDAAKRIREFFGLLVNVIDIREDIYNADVEKLMQILQELPDDKNSVMLIGHSLGASELLTSITNNAYEQLPTGSLVMVELRLRHWKDIESNTGREVLCLRPKLESN